MSKCDERFARQYRYEPPPGFPLASPSSDIVHHLSGPNTHAHTQTSLRRSKVGRWCKNPNCYFHCAHEGLVHVLAHVCGLLGPCFKTGQFKPSTPTPRAKYALQKDPSEARHMCWAQLAGTLKQGVVLTCNNSPQQVSISDATLGETNRKDHHSI